MTPLEELAAKLRTFWLRDIGATAASVSGTGSDGSVALARTLFIPAAGGLVGINQIPTDPYALDVVGNGRIAGNLYARAGNSWNIGADGTPWGAIYASELHVGNLVAENKIATTGGRILVSPSAKLILAVTTGATTIDIATNVFTSGDRLYLESTGKLEWMAVTSGATAVNGGYRYSVTRNLNGAGAQTWSAGAAVVNTGQSGQGFIDLYARYGIPANGQTATTREGPTIVGNVRTGSTFDAIKERWAVGNLKGLYDYAATEYGFAAGNPSAAWFALDASNGLRMMQAATTRVQLTAAGVFAINDSDGHAVFTFNASAGAEFTLPLTLGANGGIYQGTGTFASPTTGLKIFNSGGVGKIAGYNSGTVQWYADTDGKLYAGAGNVWLDANGLAMLNSISSAPTTNAVRWVDSGGATLFKESTYLSAGIGHFHLAQMSPPAANDAYWSQVVDRATGQSTYMLLRAVGNTSTAQIILRGFDASQATAAVYGLVSFETAVAHYLNGSLGFKGATSGVATIVAPAVAGTPTLTLPTATGTLALTSDIPAAGSVSTKTADYTTVAADGTILVSASTADITIDLLNPVAYSGKIVYYKKLDTSAYYVRLVARAGTVEASHAVNLAPNANYAAVGVQSDGAQWWVISAVGSYTLTPASGALWALNWFGQGAGFAGAGATRQRGFGRGKQYLFGQSFGGR